MSQIKYLTDIEREKINSLRAEGLTLLSIAKELHRSKTTIGIYLRHPEGYLKCIEMGLNPSELIKSLNPEKLVAQKPIKVTIKNEQQQQPSVVDDENEFNKVSLEHRSIIKFLTKKGYTASNIYDELKSVYGKSPSFPKIEYWSEQYLDGRTTIMNEPKKQTVSTIDTSASQSPKSKIKKPIKRLSNKKTNKPKLIQIKLNMSKNH